MVNTVITLIPLKDNKDDIQIPERSISIAVDDAEIYLNGQIAEPQALWGTVVSYWGENMQSQTNEEGVTEINGVTLIIAAESYLNDF